MPGRNGAGVFDYEAPSYRTPAGQLTPPAEKKLSFREKFNLMRDEMPSSVQGWLFVSALTFVIIGIFGLLVLVTTFPWVGIIIFTMLGLIPPLLVIRWCYRWWTRELIDTAQEDV